MINLALATDHLKTGGVIIYPTDTAYAIGCAYDNKAAIRQIMKYKGRRDSKFTLIASSLQQVEKFFPLTSIQKKLARTYWPGPLSIVVSKQFAVRVPDQEIARSLARRVGKPLIATSFNKSGEPEVYDLTYYAKAFITHRAERGGYSANRPVYRGWLDGNEICIINLGPLPKRKPSTVVEYKNNQLIVHRRGSITL